MIKNFTLATIILTGMVSAVHAQSPVINGQFSASEGWLLAANGDGNEGWAGANAKKLYVAYDASYVYFGAEIKADDWMQYIFVVNTKSGGGSSDSWGRTITYNHANKPDFLFRGDIGQSNYSEFHSWNGSSWSGTGTNVNSAGTEAKSTYDGSRNGFLEIRVPRSIIEFPEKIDVQFIIGGNNSGEANGHGNFDSAPTDNTGTSWSAPGNATSVSVYASPVSLPASLARFTGELRNGNVFLTWNTLSESNLDAFEIESSADGRTWSRAGTLRSQETPNGSRYEFVINGFSQSFALFRLKITGKNGEVSYSNLVTIKRKTTSNIELIGNPARGIIRVAIHQPEAETLTGELLSLQGGRLATVQHQHSGGSSVLNLPVNGMPSGHYLIRVSSSKGAETLKVIVQ